MTGLSTLNRRHVDPPLNVDDDDDDDVIASNDTTSHDSIDNPVDDVVIDLRDPATIDRHINRPIEQLADPRLGRTGARTAVRQVALPVAIDVSTTLDNRAPDEAKRLVLGLAKALAEDDGIDLQLLDGRSGQLRSLSSHHQQALHRGLEAALSGTRDRLERRLARTGLRSRRWEPKPNTWFLDIEPAWLGSIPRATLLPELEAAGVRIAAFVPDVDPLRQPHWFGDQVVTNFRQWLRAHRTAASTWLTASLATADDLVNWLGPRSKNRDVKLLTLGVGDGVRFCRLDRSGGTGRLLMVGSVTSRSGHQLILDALDLLADGQSTTHGQSGPTVDVVGSPVGGQHELMAALEHHRHVRVHHHLSESRLEGLWQEASFLLAPSLSDGVGLAIVDAMARSVPVAITNLAALAEASQGLATAVKPGPQYWADFLRDRADRYPTAAARATRFVSSSWSEASADLARHLQTIDRKPVGTVLDSIRQ